MAKEGGCLFKIGYFFYSRTGIGRIYHNRDIAKAREKYPLGTYHSKLQAKGYNDLLITPIPILLDNYSYLIQDTKDGTSVVVDPGDPEPVINYLNEQKIIPNAVLITHKHWDHSGGNAAMKRQFPDLKIFGGKHDSVPDITNNVDHGHILEFGNLKFHVKFTPGHTVGHMIYILDGEVYGTADSAFTGDILFLAGMGRMFEGSPLQNVQTLDLLCSEIKLNTMLWPGHEYALDNLEFSCHIEPSNAAAQEKLSWVKEQRAKKLCTCPSTLEEELQYNPFLRTKEESLLRAMDIIATDSIQEPNVNKRGEMLKEIRERKDQFKYKL